MKTLRVAALATLLCLSPLSARLARVNTHATQNTSPEQAIADDHYTAALLQKYHLKTARSPFSYEHKTEVYNAFLGQSMPIPDTIERLAREVHSHLNNSYFFKDTKQLFNTKKVRQALLKRIPGQSNHGELVKAVTSDGHHIDGLLLKRGSNKLIVVGAGFTNNQELMAPFTDIFNTYDVLIFNYRGHGDHSSHPLRPNTWKSLSKRLFGIDSKHVTLGEHEEKDVFAIVKEVQRKYTYKETIGLGVCYSGLIFTKTAALYPNLFNRLILDGCWFSLQHAVEILVKDPGMITRPQAHSKLADNWLVRQRWFQRFIISLAQRILDVEFATTSILDFAPNLSPNLEVLFIHGKNDLLIPRELFEILWQAVPCRRKTAILTSNPHVRNHWKQKELYKEVCELFIERSYEQFSHLLVTPEALIDVKTAALQQKLG